MTHPRGLTVMHAFTAIVGADPTAPLMTFYDDRTGERVELSGATLGNWVAKTANLLVDGHGLGPGQIATVRLPPHWQSAAILLGCWSAGLIVDLTGGTAADVAFVTTSELPLPPADETYALSLAPLGLPFPSGPPAGTHDFTLEVRGYGDQLPPIAAAPDQLALIDGTNHADLLSTAVAQAVSASRVLIDGDADPDPRTWLVAPFAAGASVVLCRHLDRAGLASRLAAERAQLYPPSTEE